MKIKKGDTVLITSGKDKNKSGKVIDVFPKENKLMVENLNLVKKHVRPKKRGEKEDWKKGRRGKKIHTGMKESTRLHTSVDGRKRMKGKDGKYGGKKGEGWGVGWGGGGGGHRMFCGV